MKKIISSIIFIILLFINIPIWFAHPLDISVSTANFKKNNIHFTTYFHSFEVEYLLRNNNIDSTNGITTYYDNSNILENYIKNNISIKNNGTKCRFNNFELRQDDAHQILSQWLATSYSFICDNDIEKLDIEVKYFIEFPLQTNRITFYNLNNGIKNIKPLLYKVLTNKIYNLEIDINNINNNVRIDSDNDGLSDQEEKIYATDPHKIDTDWDNYSDREEVDYGWNPIDPELWPAQEFRHEMDLITVQKSISNLEEISANISAKNLSDFGYWNDYLKKVMKYIDDFFTHNEWNIFYVFLIVFGLGIIHAIWPGHSKSLIVAYTLERNHWYTKWIFFAFIFTLTHILDILLLFLITKVIVTFIDISKFNYYIQFISAFLLFFLSLFLLYKAYNRKQSQHLNKKPEKTSLFIAFLAWLAPCSFAWSIFLLLLAVGKSSWIIPLVIALWLWIFTTLVWIVLLAVFLKNKIYAKAENIWIYSSFLSAWIIFIISIVMITRVL